MDVARKKKELKLEFDCEITFGDYEKLISNTTNDEKGVQRLHKDSLEIFNKHLSEIEKFECEIKHLNSRLHFKFDRKDTPHLSANGYCHAAKNCPVTYKIYKKDIPERDRKYVTIKICVYDEHNHEIKNDQVRGKKREELAEKIFSQHGGSANAARLHELGENGSIQFFF